jgi:hypothetical protein
MLLYNHTRRNALLRNVVLGVGVALWVGVGAMALAQDGAARSSAARQADLTAPTLSVCGATPNEELPLADAR